MNYRELKVLKVPIYRTGFAGQWHAKAFFHAGAEVVGIVGCTDRIVQEVAGKIEIPYASTNWSEALLDCKPDIVSIANPGGAHFDVACKQWRKDATRWWTSKQ